MGFRRVLAPPTASAGNADGYGPGNDWTAAGNRRGAERINAPPGHFPEMVMIP